MSEEPQIEKDNQPEEESQPPVVEAKAAPTSSNIGTNLSIIFGAAIVSAGLYFGLNDDFNDKPNVTCEYDMDYSESKEQIKDCINFARWGLKEAGFNGYDMDGDNKYVEIDDIDITLIARPKEEAPKVPINAPEKEKSRPKVTCLVTEEHDDAVSDQINDCINRAKWAFRDQGLNGGFVGGNGEYLLSPVHIDDLDVEIINQNSSLVVESQAAFTCHIKPEEDAERKMLHCRVSANDADIDRNAIQYVFD